MKLPRIPIVLLAAWMLVAHPVSARELTEGEWYLQLKLSSATEALEDTGNTLGQLADALADYDSYDLHELGQPFAGTYLSVIFYRPDWDTLFVTDEGSWDMGWEDFNSDFRPISYIPPIPGCALEPGTEPGDEWTFEVRSDDTARALTLTWEASEGANLEQMVLVDLQENVTVPAVIDGVIQQYAFTMNGAVRAFSWRLLSDEEYAALNGGGAGAAPLALEAGAGRAAALSADNTPASQGSGWLPKGWSPDYGDGYDQPVPDGLPSDPLAD